MKKEKLILKIFLIKKRNNRMDISFFDKIYNYIVSIDNDCSSQEDKDFIYQYIQKYLEPKLKENNNISEFLKLGKETLLEREIIKEIGITILLDYEENLDNSIFYTDIINSKDYNNFKKYIYYPSLKMI